MRRRTLLLLAGSVALVVLCLPFDAGLVRALAVEDKGPLEEKGWYQVLRQTGYLPTWLLLAFLIYLHDRARPPAPAGLHTPPAAAPPDHHRAGLVALSAALSGLAAEILKLVFMRSRPNLENDGAVTFSTPFTGFIPGNGGGLGLPSSHTAVAFGGCVMLGLLLRPVRWPLVLLAAGCGLSRLLAGAHNLSDVVAGALVATWIATALYREGEGLRRAPGRGLIVRP
ncbi:MAG: phosphatase PAP2 family protein [Planctomycetota bacterium]